MFQHLKNIKPSLARLSEHIASGLTSRKSQPQQTTRPPTPRVHLHTVIWNERHTLDFFFRHYEPWVERFYFYDDGSTDGTREYLETRDDVDVQSLTREHPDSWIKSAQQIYNTSWLRSGQDIDWVLVTNIDEHIHHPDMVKYLQDAKRDGVTAIPALGYQMMTDEFPRPDSLLRRDHRLGAPWAQMSKLCLFDPKAIRSPNFGPGRHRADPVGQVVYPSTDEICNLHYKYLGLTETQARHVAQSERLRPTDRKNRWGHKYHWNIEKLSEDFEEVRSNLVDTAIPGCHLNHTEARWWRKST
jgi:hypothetical protein